MEDNAIYFNLDPVGLHLANKINTQTYDADKVNTTRNKPQANNWRTIFDKRNILTQKTIGDDTRVKCAKMCLCVIINIMFSRNVCNRWTFDL